MILAAFATSIRAIVSLTKAFGLVGGRWKGGTDDMGELWAGDGVYGGGGGG